MASITSSTSVPAALMSESSGAILDLSRFYLLIEAATFPAISSTPWTTPAGPASLYRHTRSEDVDIFLMCSQLSQAGGLIRKRDRAKGGRSPIHFPSEHETSARNQLDGVVARVEHGAVMSTVVIRLVGGQEVVLAITNDSAEALELAEGDQVKAVIKATEGVHR